MDVLSLLESKNRCLQKFLDLSVQFLASAEAGDLSELARFHDRREAILRTISLFDRKITESVAGLREADKTDDLVAKVRESLADRETLVRSILGADEKIMGIIEREKNDIQRELNSFEKSKSIVKRFKSGWMPPAGGELDEKL